MWNIPATVLARFGPWFGRLIRSSPDVLPKLSAALATRGISVGSTVSDVVKYVRSHPMNAAVVLSTLVTVGISLKDLFTSKELNDPAVQATAERLKVNATAPAATATQTALPMAIDARVLAAGAHSQSLTLDLGKSEDLELARQTLSWARAFFGSTKAALAAHDYMQAFFEMPRKTVDDGFRNLKLG